MARKKLALSTSALIVFGASSLTASSVAHADETPSASAPAEASSTTPATPNKVGESPGVVPAIPVKQQDQSASSYPAIGGHLGMALPIVTFGKETTLVGSDFTTVGITPGVTVHLDEHWAIDFEFIAFNEMKNTPSATTLVVDPGVLRKFDGFIVGLRVATQVGAPSNVGLVPIFVLPVKISNRLAWFLEIDVPLFLRDDGKKLQPSATALFQTGVGF